MIKVGNDWYHVQGSAVVKQETVANNQNGWWYCNKDGKVDFSYNGLASNANGTWVIQNGKVNFGYNGRYTFNGKIYNVSGGCVKSEVAHEHTYVPTVTKEATCTEAGIRTYKCSGCDASYTETIPAIGHDYQTKETVKATCTAEGKVVKVCSHCGDVQTDVIPKADHTYVLKETIPGTCQEAGKEIYECSKCGDTYTKETEKADHDYVLKETVEPTCTEDGKEVYECKVCGETKEETLYSSGHHFTSKVLKEATCLEDGEIEKTCSVCGETVIEKVKGNHNYKKADGTYNYVVTKEPTCTEKGERTLQCVVCGQDHPEEMSKLEISALGHDWEAITEQVKVIDQEAYDEEVLDHWDSWDECQGCGAQFVAGSDDAIDHIAGDVSTDRFGNKLPAGCPRTNPNASVTLTNKEKAIYKTVHHDEVSHMETIIKGYRCTRCGETKSE